MLIDDVKSHSVRMKEHKQDGTAFGLGKVAKYIQIKNVSGEREKMRFQRNTEECEGNWLCFS